MIEQWWPDSPEDPPYELPDDRDCRDPDPSSYISGVLSRWGLALGDAMSGVAAHSALAVKKGFHTTRAAWDEADADPIADIEAVRKKMEEDPSYVPPHTWHTHLSIFKPKRPIHIHLEDDDGVLCIGEHPTTKTLKNGREMPIVKRGTGPRRGQFEKGGKGHYDRKSTNRGR